MGASTVQAIDLFDMAVEEPKPKRYAAGSAT